jgi:hypothetical protein
MLARAPASGLAVETNFAGANDRQSWEPGLSKEVISYNQSKPSNPYWVDGISASSSLCRGIIPGTNHLFHISSILLWKYSMSSSTK